MRKRLTGLVSAAFTPMRADGALNLPQIEPLVDSMHRDGVAGLFVCGSTGEGPLLTVEERRAVAAAFVAAARGRMPVIVHVGSSSPAEAALLAAHAQEIGADAVAAVAPWYFKPATVELLVDCLVDIAAAAPRVPFYYYHIPVMTGVSLDVVEVLRQGARRIPNLAGLKYTHNTLDEFLSLVRLDGGRYDVLFGRDEMLLAGLALGAQGAIGTTYNFAAPLFRRVIEAFQNLQLDEARHCQAQAVSMISLLLRLGGLGAFKGTMRLLGVDCGPVRRPVAPIDDAQLSHIECELKKIGFFDWGRK